MLSKLSLDTPFRGLAPKTFPGTLRFGRRTIVYGHNGSGKSSLAELLYQISRSEQQCRIFWTDEADTTTVLKPEDGAPDVVTSVFCKSWIRENLESFLDGDSAAAIVAFGKEAVDAKSDEKSLEANLRQLHKDEAAAKRAHADAAKASKAVVGAVQDAIEGTLRDVDHRLYTKNRFNDPKVRQLLAESPQSFPNGAEQEKNLDILARGPLVELGLGDFPVLDLQVLLKSARELLSQDVQSDLISSILGNKPLQQWLEDGLSLHQDQVDCYFCGGELTAERLHKLRLHFDESRKRVQSKSSQLIEQVAQRRVVIATRERSIPEKALVYPDLVAEFETALDEEVLLTSRVKDALDLIERALQRKFDAPERLDITLDVEVPVIPGSHLKDVCARHDDMVARAEGVKKQAASQVLLYLIGSHSGAYRALAKTEEQEQNSCQRIADTIVANERLLREVRAKQFSSKEVADRITHDLTAVYGKRHLSIEVDPDGKTYRCIRDGLPAQHLSDGERNTLALLYFLRHLEDEEVNVEADKRLVVVDDPSSSLDREALFATHSWLLQSLSRFGQSIVMTHDFEMLRLFLNSQKNQLSSHRGTIADGEKSDASIAAISKAKAECKFPRIAFLELRTRGDASGKRQSALSPLSETFLNYQSEYHFLFDRILTGIESPEDHELLFLLPNAARRVLESFTSFQVPGRAQFEQRLKKVAREDCNEEYRDVYDFCNRFSHGEGREPQLTLDARTVSEQIRRCMELLKSVAPEHYKEMSKATGRKRLDPLTGKPWRTSLPHNGAKPQYGDDGTAFSDTTTI